MKLIRIYVNSKSVPDCGNKLKKAAEFRKKYWIPAGKKVIP